MNKRKALILTLIFINLLVSACVYVVLPAGLDLSRASSSQGWSAVVTEVSQTSEGDVRIALTLRNDTGNWSTLKAGSKPAVLNSGGKTTNCDASLMSTGGHRLAPGFQMRGYIAGTKAEPVTQLIYIECKGAQVEPGATLTVDYVSFSGDLDYYHQEDRSATGTFKLELDEVQTDLSYPVFETFEGLIQPADVDITAISENVISLIDWQRLDDGFDFTWQNFNPTEFALKVHIGNPPVICEDGIIYGYYEIMDLSSPPLSPAGGQVNWTTKARTPAGLNDCFVLLSVESKNMRNYVNYAIALHEQ